MDDEEAQFFEERAQKKSFAVQTHDGRVFDGTDLTVETNTISWNDPDSDKRIQIAAHQVQQIVFVSRKGGFFDGFLAGLGIGVAVGGILGYAGGDDCESGSEWCFPRSTTAFLGAVIVGIPIGVVGGLIGLQNGTTHIYYPASVKSQNNALQSIPTGTTEPSN